jgi:hypothetical protein
MLSNPCVNTSVVPRNLDQACEALSISKRLINDVLSGLSHGTHPTSSQFQRLPSLLRKIADKIENWRHTRYGSANGNRTASPVTQDADKGPEPSSAVGEDCDESDDWVEVTVSTGVIRTYESNSYHCGGAG